jgi:eukaryotic-like serine/threonine-protein kinase
MSEPKDRPVSMPPLMLAQLLDEQRRRWRQGERVLVENILTRLPALRADRAIVLDLIYNEIVLREQDGERARQEEYLRRFPHLSQELTLQFEVDRFLNAPNLDAGSGHTEPQPAGGMPFPSLPGFQIHGVLGRGGMGVVYKARQLSFGRLVAVKMVLTGVRTGSAELAKCRAEAEGVARLHSRHIASVYEIGTRDGRLYSARELLNASLAKHEAGIPQPGHQAAKWLETLARTIHAAHKAGIVHRALKPTNILLSAKGAVKITDFGLANLLSPARSAVISRGILGSPSYLAPEQAGGAAQPAGPAADVYSLGAILYELLTGRPPFRGATIEETLGQIREEEAMLPSVLQPNVSHDLETICLHCMRKDPSQRYPSAEALALDLAAHLRGERVRARRPGIGGRVARWTASWLNASKRPTISEAVQQRLVIERRAERLHLQLELARRLMTRPASLDDLLRRLAETTVWLADAELATIFVLDHKSRELWSKVTLDKTVGEIRIPLGVGIAGAAAVGGKTIHIPDVSADARFNPADERHVGPNPRNLLVLPMPAHDGHLVGIMQVANKQEGGFEEEDIETLSTFAASAAVALELALGPTK